MIKKQLDLCRNAFTSDENVDNFAFDTMWELHYSFNIDGTLTKPNELFRQNY